MAEKGDSLFIGAQDAIDAVLLAVAEAFEEITAASVDIIEGWRQLLGDGIEARRGEGFIVGDSLVEVLKSLLAPR